MADPRARRYESANRHSYLLADTGNSGAVRPPVLVSFLVSSTSFGFRPDGDTQRSAPDQGNTSRPPAACYERKPQPITPMAQQLPFRRYAGLGLASAGKLPHTIATLRP